jgi:hypothetical protein
VSFWEGIVEEEHVRSDYSQKRRRVRLFLVRSLLAVGFRERVKSG